MPIINFKIGEAFPHDDPVARFVSVLAMASNDWNRGMAHQAATTPGPSDPERAGIAVMFTRQQAATCFEATKFIRESRHHFPEIGAFLDGLDDEAQGELAKLEAVADQHAAEYQAWLKGHRDVTAHFPALHPEKYRHGNEEMANALHAAANDSGTISMDEDAGNLRFHYADTVAVCLLPNLTETPTAGRRCSLRCERWPPSRSSRFWPTTRPTLRRSGSTPEALEH